LSYIRYNRNTDTNAGAPVSCGISGPQYKSPDSGGHRTSVRSDKSPLSGFLDEFDIRILYASRVKLAIGAWNHDNLANEFWRLYQNDAPGGTFTCQNKSIDLIPGGVYLIPGSLELSCRNTRCLEHFFVHFDLRGDPPFDLRDLFKEPMHIDAGADFRGIVAEARSKMTCQNSQGITVQCQLKSVVYSAFGYYLEHLPEELFDVSLARLQAMQPVSPALHLIEQQLGQPLTNRELANACAMSENHFIRRFREAIGVTPAAFIQQKRLAVAAQLLRYTDDSIDSIAMKTGFTDRFYFSRAFRRTTGRPPAAYRRLPRI